MENEGRGHYLPWKMMRELVFTMENDERARYELWRIGQSSRHNLLWRMRRELVICYGE
jgi:hypothetical protein